MLTVFVLVALYLAGVFGSTLAWVDTVYFNAHLDRCKPVYCPSPIGIILILFGGFTGPVMFVVGPIALWTSYIVINPRPRGWWRTPICQQKRK